MERGIISGYQHDGELFQSTDLNDKCSTIGEVVTFNRHVFFLGYFVMLHVKYAVTRNDDCFEGSHLHALGGILKRTVRLRYK